MPTINVIEDSPFRVLGLSVDATDRQIAKRVNELSTLYEFGKSKSYVTDFPFISSLNRSSEAIVRAASQIELPEQKLFHANFWFWSDNSIDELVYDVLRDGNIERATSLWQRPPQDKGLTQKTYSNYKNLALLNLIQSLQGTAPENVRLTLAIRQFLVIFSNPNYADFCSRVSGSTHKTDAAASEKSFIDELLKHLDLRDSDADVTLIKKFISATSHASDETQSYVKMRFVEVPMHRIEQELATLSDARRYNPKDIYKKAKYSFHSSIADDLKYLKEVLTVQDFQYQSLADRIADELLQCSTVYFNANYEDDTTNQTIDRSRELTVLAQKIAVGQRAQNKVRDDLLQIKKLSEDGQAMQLATKFMKILEKYKSPDDITTSQLLDLPESLGTVFTRAQAILTDIKTIAGENDETYTYLSNLLACLCIGLSIRYANATDNFNSILPVLRRVKALKMDMSTRNHLVSNLRILEANSQVANANKGSGGCYIATMAFGSYNAPEVLVLRQFRDDTLARSRCGRAFIRIYYQISPLIVRALRNRHGINRVIRRCLSLLVRELK